jgi:hypothetical protein
MSNPDYSFWNLLEPVQGPAGTMTARVPFPDLCNRELAAIDSDGGRHYLISISDETVAVSDVRSRGISVNTEELRIRGSQGKEGTSRYIDITCLDTSLYDGFDLVGYQIAETISLGGITEGEAVLGVLSRWRYFWSTASGSILSKNAIIGLFSELRFISRWLLPYMDVRAVISSWRGPLGGRHDFEWIDRSVEVKGTTSVHGRRHWVHGLEQLLPPENGKLFLFSLQIREEIGAAETLPGVIEECRNLLRGSLEAMNLFEDLLAEAGYYPFHAAEYGRIHFRVVDEALYRVEEAFPRITEDVLHGLSISGVTEIDYEISLDGFNEYIVTKRPIPGFF